MDGVQAINPPFFSVVIPTFNRAEQISAPIQSVINQTFKNWELLVIDDGSTDNTKEIVTAFADARIKYIYQENAERSVARNNGIKHASADWICFLDSDDHFLPEHLNLFFDEIKTSNFKGVLLSGQYVNKKGKLNKHPLLDTNSQDVCKKIWDQFILMDSTCVHKDCFSDHQFPEQFSIWEDTHLWLRLAATFPFKQLQTYTSVQEWSDQGSVYQTLIEVKMSRVNRYIGAIHHLEKNYLNLFEGKLNKTDFTNYIDKKYKLFIYQSRQNKQFKVVVQVWAKAMVNKPSLSLFLELPKAFLNLLNIGIQTHF